ncbi:MAG: hybrid sensor histidine kinase/response regulator [Burkholderiales bacterium]|nr:hybrid sensor histidine kinase/response regulator [Burkholderiales bacterium]MDE1926191.1 hybrid sensor histidine kinase/response regulator [Burkholderiales bacterium]MDE2157605.1 hybrid sensor histidine kinase/response regulator [Burkholderiales bacterium]MDE2503378.1 hybrid sensor histidine kinase/response regulator [Burkholderiales bacterium]
MTGAGAGGAAEAGEAAPAATRAPPTGSGVEHLRALYVQTPATLTGNLVGMGLIAVIFGPLADRRLLLPWLAVISTLWLVRLAHYLRFRLRHRRTDAATWQRWRRSWMALVLIQASMWGLAVWLFWGLGTPYHKVALVLIAYTYCLASVQLLATQAGIFLAFLSLVLTPTIARIASDRSEPFHLQLAVILALMFCITVLMGRTYGTALGYAISLKARTDELAARLRAEMGISDEARRAAEAANRAKTQFFAAASHDLRQPLHAMGLFAEALRQRSRDAEVASLVNSINESVDALEGLFGELLDITRIDTGGVEVHPAPVRLHELFARLRLHFEPVAFEKGLMLHFRGGRHVVQADPVLLERTLRNLVSNAIRYTEDGGVLVSCRRRAGRLLLQVWDSGIGIAPANLARVWEEFYQVHTQPPLDTQQRKGLGLGLAIVKRMADLMQTPIALRSRLGHGTVFTLEVPAGRVARAAVDMVPAAVKPPLGLTLQGRLILVLEDEAAVREGLVVVLQAWGADVIAFEAVEALQAWADAAPPRAPDLLLVDYRLPQGRTGIEAMTLLRARWRPRRLPAILITGSSLGGHEDEAERHDYHLLIKPVLPNKLRAMIAFKLGLHG